MYLSIYLKINAFLHQVVNWVQKFINPKSGTFTMIDILRCISCIRSYSIFLSPETGGNFKLLYTSPFHCCSLPRCCAIFSPKPFHLQFFFEWYLDESYKHHVPVLLSSSCHTGRSHDWLEEVTLSKITKSMFTWIILVILNAGGLFAFLFIYLFVRDIGGWFG